MTMESIVSTTISLYSFGTTPFTIKALTGVVANQNTSRASAGVCGFGVSKDKGSEMLNYNPLPRILSI